MKFLKQLLFSLILFSFLSSPVFAENLPKGIINTPAKPAPTLALEDMDGVKANLAQSKGKWIFVHFWASWCGPCRKEMPAIQQLINDMQGKNLDFYIINTAEDEDTIFEFLASSAPDLNSLMDRNGLATEKWQPRGLPATYLVDPEGIVRYQALGGRDWHSPAYQAFINKLLPK